MVTRADVARRAGTSTAVVSYVINDGPRPVAAETRRRVLDAIAELGYRPNRVAQALRGQRSRVLGLIVPDISNPFYAELARIIENCADLYGYTLVLGTVAATWLGTQYELSRVRLRAEAVRLAGRRWERPAPRSDSRHGALAASNADARSS